MNATLTYKLPEEREEFLTALNAGTYVSVLIELDNWLRSTLKYTDEPANREDARVMLQELRDLLTSELANTNWRD